MSAQAATASSRGVATPVSPSLLIGALVVVLLLLCAVSLAVGRAPLDVGSAFAQWMRGESTLATLVLVELRVPRTRSPSWSARVSVWPARRYKACCATRSPSQASSACRRARRSARSSRSTAVLRSRHRSHCRWRESQVRWSRSCCCTRSPDAKPARLR